MAIDKDLAQNSRVLKQLAPEALDQLDILLVRKEWPAEAVIFQEGSSGDVMYFIERGAVTITKTVEGDVQTPLATFGQGQCFGEMSLIDNSPRSATAKTLEPSVLLSLSRDNFRSFLDKDPRGAAMLLLGVLAEVNERLRQTDEVLRDTIYWGMRAGGHLDIAKE